MMRPLSSGPVAPILEPGDVVNDGHATRLDAAVIAVDRFVPADRRVGKTLGFLLVGEQFDILAQRALVALQRQDGLCRAP